MPSKLCVNDYFVWPFSSSILLKIKNIDVGSIDSTKKLSFYRIFNIFIICIGLGIIGFILAGLFNCLFLLLFKDGIKQLYTVSDCNTCLERDEYELSFSEKERDTFYSICRGLANDDFIKDTLYKDYSFLVKKKQQGYKMSNSELKLMLYIKIFNNYIDKNVLKWENKESDISTNNIFIKKDGDKILDDFFAIFFNIPTDVGVGSNFDGYDANSNCTSINRFEYIFNNNKKLLLLTAIVAMQNIISAQNILNEFVANGTKKKLGKKNVIGVNKQRKEKMHSLFLKITALIKGMFEGSFSYFLSSIGFEVAKVEPRNSKKSKEKVVLNTKLSSAVSLIENFVDNSQSWHDQSNEEYKKSYNAIVDAFVLYINVFEKIKNGIFFLANAVASSGSSENNAELITKIEKFFNKNDSRFATICSGLSINNSIPRLICMILEYSDYDYEVNYNLIYDEEGHEKTEKKESEVTPEKKLDGTEIFSDHLNKTSHFSASAIV